jgi:hypothetical protein
MVRLSRDVSAPIRHFRGLAVHPHRYPPSPDPIDPYPGVRYRFDPIRLNFYCGESLAAVALRSGRHHARNHLTAVAPVNAKVGIGGENDGVGAHFGHAYQAGIGETHGEVCVLLHEL